MQEETELFFSSISSQLRSNAAANLNEIAETFRKRNEKLTLAAKENWYQKLLEDPLLSDVTRGSALEDVESLIALETGTAFTVNILRQDGEKISKIFSMLFCYRPFKAFRFSQIAHKRYSAALVSYYHLKRTQTSSEIHYGSTISKA